MVSAVWDELLLLLLELMVHNGTLTWVSERRALTLKTPYTMGFMQEFVQAKRNRPLDNFGSSFVAHGLSYQ